MLKLFSKKNESPQDVQLGNDAETETAFFVHPTDARGPKGQGFKGNWKFDLEKVIYNGGVGSFSIAVGFCDSDSYEAQGKMLAIRWNGANVDPADIGFPTTGPLANWFPVPRQMNGAILDSLHDLKTFDSLFDESSCAPVKTSQT